MEDEDEFGDLYTDVLRPFSSPPSSVVQQPQLPTRAPIHLNRPIDLNLQSNTDNDTLYGAPNPNSTHPQKTTLETLAHDSNALRRVSAGPDSISADQRQEDSALGSIVFKCEDAKLPTKSSKDASLEETGLGDNDKDVKFDIEEGNAGIDDDPIIPGLSGAESGGKLVLELVENQEGIEGSRRLVKDNDILSGGRGGEGEGEDWDSDSEDDLQIVLNDNNHHGPMGIERGTMAANDDEDEDEDGDTLVIVTNGDPNQAAEEQEWGEDVGQAADGERKEAGEAGKASGGGAAVAPKIGYSNHGYHPFHSQFKYVRPGAAPIPGATATGPGGASGQIRPLVNMAGRGRGDWRAPGMKNAPPMQKGFHPGFGTAWGNNMSGRGFGGGLEFTLPSHKTIFDVDIDGFEEKPWKYQGVDISDFFNFGLNEDSWKDYCKQLEQHRLETTMQSKIRVYESGRTEQEYDPDLPPELAAATGVQDVPADNANFRKTDLGQSDLAKISTRVRPPLPTGRAIQVEGGYGERLPSIDTRPPRIRDSDAVIEIVLQDSFDDASSTGNNVLDQKGNDVPREALRGDNVAVNDVGSVNTEYFDGLPDTYDVRKRELVERKPFMHSVHDGVPQGDGVSSVPAEASLQCHSGSRGQTPVYSCSDERRTQGRVRDRSPHLTPSRSARDENNQEEDSTESIGDRHNLLSTSPAAVRDARELSNEYKDATPDADASSVMEKEEISNEVDGSLPHSMNKLKMSSQVEPVKLEDVDDDEDSKAARSSENSKARSGSSRDYQKWRDGMEEEVIQDRHSARMGNSKKRPNDNEQNYHRKGRDGRQDLERNHVAVKGREDSYPHRDFDPSLGHHSYMKTDGFDRRKERDIPDGAWQRRDDDPYSRKGRPEDSRKREREDDMGSRQRGKIRESERSHKDEPLHSRKQLDNGSYRVHYDKDIGLRHRERDDNLKSRYDLVDDYHSKRRKDEEYTREHAERPEISHGHRESSSRRKRERDDLLDQQKRDDQQRSRDNFDDHHSVRHKDEIWLHRERGERQREREEWHRSKQSHEEILSKREREVRGAVRSGRASEDRGLVSHGRAKDEYKGPDKEYQVKDAVRHSEQLKRRGRTDDESFSHHRGREDVYARANNVSNDDRKSRQDRSTARNDRAADASDNQKAQERKHKENMRKNKESDFRDVSTLDLYKRNQEDQSGHINETGLKASGEQGICKNEVLVPHNSSRKHREDASSDDEQQDSRRGRSKLERWMSHKEKDYSINSKSSVSLKLKEIDKNNSSKSSESNKLAGEISKAPDSMGNQHPHSEEKGAGGDSEIKDADTKPLEDRHMDTVEKLKKRSERFKLPMPKEKDAVAIKKMEGEALPSAKSETPVDTEVKQERPARKRRWISN